MKWRLFSSKIFKKIQFRNWWGKLNFKFLKSLKIKGSADWLDAIVTILLKIGTLFLIIILVIFVIRIFNSQGYIIEPFSMAEELEKSGYDGYVVARKIQDEVIQIKQIAQTVKEDSMQLVGGNEQPELDLKVMGVGISLRNLVWQIRSLFAQKNKIIQGEITALDDQFQLTLRMTDFPPVNHVEKIMEGNKQEALDRLLRKAGEIIISNTDPYRIAILCYKQKRYDEAIALARRIIKERPQEVHWGYLAWGSVLEEQKQFFAAANKFKRAIELNPQFSLAHVRLAWNLAAQKEYEASIESMRLGLKYDAPDNWDHWINYAWMLHSLKKYESADSAFQKATEIAPDNPQPWNSWADSQLNRGKPEEAQKLMVKAEKLAKEDVPGYLSKAIASLSRGDTLAAFNFVMTALDLDPANETAIQSGINSTWNMRDFKKLIALFENSDLSKFNNYSRQQLNNLAAMAYNYEGMREQAFKTIRIAIDLDPTVGYPYSTLAEIFALSGDINNFYVNLEIAFQKGFSPSNIDFSLEPYASLENDPKLIDLMEKYEPKLKG